jgi:hypothetical protein
MASLGAHPNGDRSLRFRLEPDGLEIVSQPEIVIVAGYTGRDRDAVLEHILELEALGIAPPPTTPTFYPVSPQLIAQDHLLVTTEAATSGEAEVALVIDHGEVFVTVASDHTDRAVERLDIALSKRACHKMIGTTLWRLDDVIDRWDSLRVRSWIGEEASLPYQDGTLSSLLSPLDVLHAIPWRTTQPRSFVVLCGTVPTIAGMCPSVRFKAEVHDPLTERELRLEYSVETLDLLGTAAEGESILDQAGPLDLAQTPNDG